MYFVKIIAMVIIFAWTLTAWGENKSNTDHNAVLRDTKHSHQDQEYFFGISFSVFTPNDKIKSYFTDSLSQVEHAAKVTQDAFFLFGTMTKSVTSFIAAPLEKESILNLDRSLRSWFPAYSYWIGANGSFYSKTAYLISAILIEKLTHQRFAYEVIQKTMLAASILNAVYFSDAQDDKPQAGIAQAYRFNRYDNAAWLGKNLANDQLLENELRLAQL